MHDDLGVRVGAVQQPQQRIGSARGHPVYLQAMSIGNDLTFTFEDFNFIDRLVIYEFENLHCAPAVVAHDFPGGSVASRTSRGLSLHHRERRDHVRGRRLLWLDTRAAAAPRSRVALARLRQRAARPIFGVPDPRRGFVLCLLAASSAADDAPAAVH